MSWEPLGLGRPLEPSGLWNFLALIAQAEASLLWSTNHQTLLLSFGVLFVWSASQVKAHRGIHFTSRFIPLVGYELVEIEGSVYLF